MAKIKSINDELIVELDVDEFIASAIQPREVARMGGSVIAYSALDKLRAVPKYADMIEKFPYMTTSFQKGKLIIRFHKEM